MEFTSTDGMRWERAPHDGMRVPVRVFATKALLEGMRQDLTLVQAENVAKLPGIEQASIVMPDGHQGYGFPIGGVAAFREEDGVISPGGVGYDINCGVRLLTSPLSREDIPAKKDRLLDALFANVPSGLGSEGKLRLPSGEMDSMLELGARWACEHDYGEMRDLRTTEEGGRMPGDASLVSAKAKKRGSPQLGSLGSGNHFIEVQAVDTIYDERAAKAYGLYRGQVAVMVHTGSRGCGHQVCSDYLRTMERAVKAYHIALPDRELACAPVASVEGEEYLGAMSCAANFAWANRQMITHWVRESFDAVFGTSELSVLYDVAHNIAKWETHGNRRLMVHRKGATRALWKGRDEVPAAYRDTGQPVILPGSMGTASYVLCGAPGASASFGSTAHGAGRVLSRSKAVKTYAGDDIVRELGKGGIGVRAESPRTVAEEAPAAYKDIDQVADVSHRAGIALRVARLVPLGVVKG
ncbi:MAG: RtcB family protein [Candidatus Methanofastidiosa archaeon]|nr:RtcB family protein [Candidatus Methanofastidiosa archaeon]